MAKQTEAVKDRGMDRFTPAGAGNSDTKTEDLRDSTADKDPELLTTIEDRMKNLGDLTRPDRASRSNPADGDDDEDEPTPGEDEEPKDDAKAADDSRADESPKSDTPTLDDGKGLPEAYVRAAVAYGWKEDAVKDWYKTDPERSLTVLSSIYNTRNKASAEFAALGRRAKEAPVEEPKFTPVDTAALTEKYGEDAKPLIEMIEAQNKAMGQLAERLPKTQRPAQTPVESDAEMSHIEQQIHGYFESDRMKSWEKVYGKLGFGQTWDDLSSSQRNFRWQLLTKADQIAGGAHLQGVNMPVDEALEAAHLLITQKYRDQVLIDGIKANVETRSKGMTVKPSKGTRKLGAEEMPKPGSRTKEQLVEATDQKLHKIFGG